MLNLSIFLCYNNCAVSDCHILHVQLITTEVLCAALIVIVIQHNHYIISIYELPRFVMCESHNYTW